MKKSLSIILVLAMLVSILVACSPEPSRKSKNTSEKLPSAVYKELLEVMPDAKNFEKVNINEYSGIPVAIIEAYKSNNGGFVIQVEFAGFYPGNVAMIGVSAEGKVTGTKVITNTESTGFGADHLPQLDKIGHYNGETFDTIDGVDTVAGCTVSTKAYRTAVKDALVAAIVLAGGSVDLRTPEQKLNDNLNDALGTSGVEFEKHFFMEVVRGVDAIYTAKTGEGYVVVIGEEFIGVDADGNVVGGTNEVAAAAVATIKATTFTEINPQDYGASKRVKSALVTNNGVFVLEVEGSGFGKKGDDLYLPSGEYILIRVAIAPDGQIIDCYTIYQNETKGLGDVCGTEEFYSQFAGKNKDNYEDVVIAGASITTDGYHGAIKNAYIAIDKFIENK